MEPWRLSVSRGCIVGDTHGGSWISSPLQFLSRTSHLPHTHAGGWADRRGVPLCCLEIVFRQPLDSPAEEVV